jgi:hypothetical protein
VSSKKEGTMTERPQPHDDLDRAAVPRPEDPLTALFGNPISVYTRQQAIDDGVLVDVSEWASADKGFMGGFSCPVAMTRALWTLIDTDALPKGRRPCGQSTRGRAHDVLFMASLALRGAFKRQGDRADTLVIISRRKVRVRAVVDGDGVTIGFPEDF